MLQIFIIYYVPGLLFNYPLFSKIDRYIFATYVMPEKGTLLHMLMTNAGGLIAVLIAFVINYACYFSEIYRAGIESVPFGQTEAGRVLGMTKAEIFFRVTLLQVIKRIIPPMGNEIITLVKDTALARVIMVVEIIKVAEKFTSRAMIWPLFYTAVFYLIFVGVLTILFGKAEKKLSYFKV